MCMHKLSDFHINFSNASAGQGLNTVLCKTQSHCYYSNRERSWRSGGEATVLFEMQRLP